MQKQQESLLFLLAISAVQVATDCEILSSGIPEILASECCSQSFIICNENERVVSIVKTGLSGQIPIDINLVDQLEVFQVASGTLSGQVPESFILKEFFLGGNSLSGQLPEFSTMTGLTDFSFTPSELCLKPGHPEQIGAPR